MSYQTIVAAFDTAAHAQAAVEALKAGGFHPDDISAFDKNRVGRVSPACGSACSAVGWLSTKPTCTANPLSVAVWLSRCAYRTVRSPTPRAS